MRKIMMIFILIINCINVYSQEPIRFTNIKRENPDGGSYCSFPIVRSLSNTYEEYEKKEIKDCIDWYNDKSNNKIEYDTIIFDYPFFVYIYNNNDTIAKLMKVLTKKIDVYSKTTIDANGMPGEKIARIKGNNKSTKHNDLFAESFFIIPIDKKLQPFFCGTLMSDYFYKNFIGNMSYSKTGVERLLEERNHNSLR